MLLSEIKVEMTQIFYQMLKKDGSSFYKQNVNKLIAASYTSWLADLHEEIFLFILFGVGTGVERPEGWV